MDIATLANLINAIAVTAGVIFAAAQISYYRQRRRREAMLELVIVPKPGLYQCTSARAVVAGSGGHRENTQSARTGR
jgi:hypothetical protein